MSEITLPSDLLFRAVKATATAAATKGDTADLHCVLIAATDGVITAVATDRYGMHVVELDLPGVLDFRATPAAAELLKVVKRPKAAPPGRANLTRLTLDERFLQVETGLGRLEDGLLDNDVDAVTTVPLVDGAFPQWRALIDRLVTDPVHLTAMTGASPALLARAATAASFIAPKGSPLKLHTPPATEKDGVPMPDLGATKPLVITAADGDAGMQFRALVMPVRLPAEEADHVG